MFPQKNTAECFLVTKIVLAHASRKEALGPWIEVEPKPTVTSDQHLVLICFRGIDVTVTGGHTYMSGVIFPALLVTQALLSELSIREGINIHPNPVAHQS